MAKLSFSTLAANKVITKDPPLMVISTYVSEEVRAHLINPDTIAAKAVAHNDITSIIKRNIAIRNTKLEGRKRIFLGHFHYLFMMKRQNLICIMIVF